MQLQSPGAKQLEACNSSPHSGHIPAPALPPGQAHLYIQRRQFTTTTRLHAHAAIITLHSPLHSTTSIAGRRLAT